MAAKFQKYIKLDPNINSGMPGILGTRVTVVEILSYLEADRTIDSVVRSLKKAGVIVTKDEVRAALEFAKCQSSHETFPNKNSK